MPDLGINLICDCNLSSNWSEPIVKIVGPEELISEEVLESKHICEYCRETNYSNPYYDTDFTNNWRAKVVKNITSLSQCQDKCTHVVRNVKSNRKNCIAVAYKPDVNVCYLKFPRRKLIKIKKQGIVSSRRCVYDSFNMQNECSARKISNMGCAVYSGTREPETFMKEIPCERNESTATTSVSSVSTTYHSTTTKKSSFSTTTISTVRSTTATITVTSTSKSTKLFLSCDQGVLICGRTCLRKKWGYYCKTSHGWEYPCKACLKWTDYQYLCADEHYHFYPYIYKRFSVLTEDCREHNYHFSLYHFKNKY